MKKLLTLIALAVLATPGAVVAQTDPVAQARTLRYAGRFDEADRVLNAVLRQNPNDYMAQYNLGLVYEARAARLVAMPGPDRVALLNKSAAALEKALALRIRGNISEYTIYNTLGYVYLQLGDVTNADRVLTAGIPFVDKLTATSRAKFQANQGYLASLKGQPKAASNYFNKAAQGGNPAAQSNAARLKKQ